MLARRLRQCAAQGSRIGALADGVAVLATAGLLRDVDCTVPIDVLDAFVKMHPQSPVSATSFVLGKCPTAPTGHAVAEMMLHLIADDQGGESASQIALTMHLANARDAQTMDVISVQAVQGKRSPDLTRAVTATLTHLERPLPAKAVAPIAGISVRQTERLFRRFLHQTPRAF